MKKVITNDWAVKAALGDMTFDEHFEAITREGVPAAHVNYRGAALRGMGLKNPKEKADNVIVFGCFRPFSGQREILGYFKLLDRLGFDYTYLEKEHCCGSPLLDPVLDPDGSNRERALNQSRDSLGKNIAAARSKGAKSVAYMCMWCTHISKMLFPDEDIAQVNMLDILKDELPKHTLQVMPTTVGYYEGCHLRARHQTPEISLDWASYREMVAAIKGLEIVNLPSKLCCTHQMDRLIKEVQKHNLQTVVTPCPACIARLRPALSGIAEVKSPHDLFLEALE